MGLFRSITGIVGRWFSRKPSQKSEEPSIHNRINLVHEWTREIDEHLDILKRRNDVSVRRCCAKQKWECVLPTMLDAYLLFMSLPHVVSDKVQAWCSADDLFYAYERHPGLSLTLTDRVHGKDIHAEIRMVFHEEVVYRISIILGNRKDIQPITYDADTQNEQ